MAARKRAAKPVAQAKTPGAAEAGALHEEIAMLRTFIRMIENLADDGKPLGELLKILDMLGKSSTRLASLLRAQRALCEEKEFGAVFNQALSDVIRELGVDEAARSE
jgi:hypothetical protein